MTSTSTEYSVVIRHWHQRLPIRQLWSASKHSVCLLHYSPHFSRRKNLRLICIFVVHVDEMFVAFTVDALFGYVGHAPGRPASVSVPWPPTLLQRERRRQGFAYSLIPSLCYRKWRFFSGNVYVHETCVVAHFEVSTYISNAWKAILILGVCILLRVWDQVFFFYFSQIYNLLYRWSNK
jgi:hypothetical protein